ncbi:MAG: Ig-like domain-containing protein, partial [Clostridia bacterium]|nr:Ig-like domain-containing protein [Clostridia bacterium]
TAADSLNTSQKGIGSGASGQTIADVSGQTAGLTVAKMKTVEAFGGFDFDTVWTIKGDSTYLYPELRYASYVSGITLDKNEITLTKYNETAKLTVTVPFNLTLNTKVVWSSSNEQAVAVDQTGKLTAVGTGRAIVMAALSDGSFYATCNVSATVPELTVGESGGRPGETIRLDLTALNNPTVDKLTVNIVCTNPGLTLDSIESDIFRLEGSTLTLKTDEPCTAVGTLAVLVFKIAPDAKRGTASVKLEVTSTAGEQTVLWKATGGVIKINGFDRGDIDKNGKEDGEDVIALLRHLNNTEPLADTSMCDINRDGKLNIQDVICLINHLNGTIPFEPEPEPEPESQPEAPDTPAE